MTVLLHKMGRYCSQGFTFESETCQAPLIQSIPYSFGLVLLESKHAGHLTLQFLCRIGPATLDLSFIGQSFVRVANSGL